MGRQNLSASENLDEKTNIDYNIYLDNRPYNQAICYYI